MHPIKKVLAVSRSTKQCRYTVHFGVSLARKYDAELYVISVIHDPLNLAGWNLPLQSFEGEYKQMMTEAKKHLAEVVQAESRLGLHITEIVRDDNPVKAVVETIKQYQIDLALLLAHEEGRLEHLIFGRTNEELIRKMPCSLFLLKSAPPPDSV